MDPKTANPKSHFLSNNYFKERTDEQQYEENDFNEQGSLGGEVSSELGFGNLESAREYVEQFKFNDEFTNNQSQDNSEIEEQ